MAQWETSIKPDNVSSELQDSWKSRQNGTSLGSRDRQIWSLLATLLANRWTPCSARDPTLSETIEEGNSKKYRTLAHVLYVHIHSLTYPHGIHRNTLPTHTNNTVHRKHNEGKKKKRTHPSMMASRSKVSGIVNFLSTVNIGKLSRKIQL